MKKYKTLFAAAALALCLQPAAYAAEPLKSYMEIKDGRHLFIKTYEAAPDEDPSGLKEEPFELDGFSYSFLDMEKDEIISEEKRMKHRTKTTESKTTSFRNLWNSSPLSIDLRQGTLAGSSAGQRFLFQRNQGYTTQTYNRQGFHHAARREQIKTFLCAQKQRSKRRDAEARPGVDWSVGTSAPVD